ncbi:MAG: hypothetical protein GIW94_05250 [Candidatus Eremiobacteraeota bacterium]|nr:hypothetical protein [Candidatus Eremiobacteraeota bacterium]
MMVVLLSSPIVAFTTFTLLVGALCILGARSLVSAASNEQWARVGLPAFALFNPWVYTKLVAGHLAMIAAYGATMWLLGECSRARPRWNRVALLVCIIAAQIQFFVIALAIVAGIAVTQRRILPLVTGVVIGLPTIIGVVGDLGAITSTPYSLAWQRSQSLYPVEAAALTGYFAHYTEGFPAVAFDAVWAVLALAVVGAVSSYRRRRAMIFVALAIIAWAWSTGLHGPLMTLYAISVIRLPVLEVFRELYDLEAYVAIGYIGLAAMAARLHPLLGKATIAPGIILAATWAVLPPSRWWIPLSQVPELRVTAPDNSRVAFMPDVQPMQFRGRGSGLDPDLYPRPNDVLPLNGGVTPFPAGVALRRFAMTGRIDELRGLSVSRVYSRPWLTTNAGALGPQLALPANFPKSARIKAIALRPAPELALASSLNIVSLPPSVGSSAVFFGDVAGLRGDGIPRSWSELPSSSEVLPALRETTAARAWVDVRQAFLAQPELGQGLGGALTTSPSALLHIQPSASALVWVKGRLLAAGGRVLFRSRGGYHWIAIPSFVTALRCEGECVVAARSSSVSRIPLSAAPARLTGIRFFAPVPWLAVSRLIGRKSPSFLRYDVGYDPHLIAISRGRVFPHFRVDSFANGWIVPAHKGSTRVVIVEYVAALQLICEFVGVLWTLALLSRIALGRP